MGGANRKHLFTGGARAGRRTVWGDDSRGDSTSTSTCQPGPPGSIISVRLRTSSDDAAGWSGASGGLLNAPGVPGKHERPHSGVIRLEVFVKENESLERALRRFKRKVQRSGLYSELRKRRFYEKPSAQRKRRREAAIRRERRRQRRGTRR